MPQGAVVDPDELERFARALQQFSAQMSQDKSRLSAQFARLEETWRDQEHKKFAQDFQQTMTVLGRFTRSAEQHAPHLQQKARTIREYLGR
jgi:uncharacterized protein YukE